MTLIRHGFSIGLERIDQDFFLSLKAVGKLTHEDYQTINPFLDSALGAVDQPKVKVLFDATELEGWELRAAWDDFRLGLKHGGEFDKIALLGNKGWQKLAARVGAWFVSGEVKYFEDEGEALDWLAR
ncbi:STAS/SEC14 domain-containing protein [Gallaecimonas kandeliae]|uniref:STAS/SEC14 domain-containing protein n=1 Tax=Gallaecimonas kandeliae TaxID=3029055 RepID=UPI002648A04D|nr:STAS/SEC14 domain-containing protein [Gallaecimonas kandeliae]WKE66895.1 STAS/SEC14 domain-containing protein [Gallaecimonas kandeliae]